MQEKFTRRKAISALGLSGLGLMAATTDSAANNLDSLVRDGNEMRWFSTVAAMQSSAALKAGMLIQTSGYYRQGDGGHGLYLIKPAETGMVADNGSIIPLKKGLIAELNNVSAVNYRLFGAVGDKINDDGVQIKTAHIYANARKIPVINLTGEFWFGETNSIEIQTNVDWGQSVFHFNEKYNSRQPRFKIISDTQPVNITLDEQAKKAVIAALKPGVKIIPELAPYKNSFVLISDAGDPIGLRYNRSGIGKGWAREELFYVEEHGRIIGDIAWTFNGYTTLTAYPASNSYLTVDGGTFYLSGDNAGAYFENGIHIRRSRTLISNQWVGLEPGNHDVARIQRNGFYSLDTVFDVTLENIRLLPWEKDRVGEAPVPQGTYGISGKRMMKVTFRNITAEGSPVHWGVFGTNLTKDFRVESCILNRVDVHFHCWNLYIKDSKIGQRGLTLTGGGDLFIENTSVSSSAFIAFRADYGAKWDGDIRIRNCRLIPNARTSQVAVLQFTSADFDFKYPIGYGRTVKVEDMVIDFTSDPQSKAVCWLMRTSKWLLNAKKVALFFPEQVEFSNISVRGREQGVRLLEVFDCSSFYMPEAGMYDGVRLKSNCRMFFSNIEIEKAGPLQDAGKDVQLYLNSSSVQSNVFALYPEIKVVDCKNLQVFLGASAAGLKFDGCSVNAIAADTGSSFRGRLLFKDCEFIPVAADNRKQVYDLAAELGTSFTDCVIYAPQIGGADAPDHVHRTGIIAINKWVRYNHTNTRLGNDIVKYYKRRGIALYPEFVRMLKNHHELEKEDV